MPSQLPRIGSNVSERPRKTFLQMAFDEKEQRETNAGRTPLKEVGVARCKPVQTGRQLISSCIEAFGRMI